MKTKWNLGLLYQNDHDPQIDKDFARMVRTYRAFEKKWKGNERIYTDEQVLFEALRDYEDVYRIGSWSKPVWYFQLLKDIQTDNNVASARASQLSQGLAKEWNRIIFFILGLGMISESNQKKFLSSELLKPYRYHLKKIFDTARYQLAESEEKIFNLTEATSYDLWVDGVKKQLGTLAITHKGRLMGIGEAAKIAPTLPRKERKELAEKTIAATKTVAPFAESEMNAVLTLKKISDELRGYAKPYSSEIIGNQNDEAAIERLVDLVTEHAPVAHRFFKLKKRMLGLSERLRSYDINADVGKISKKFPFEDAVKIVRDSFYDVDPEFARLLDEYLDQGQIDAMPRLHKRSGAYCWKHKNLPTFVLLNHVPDFDSVRTLAHEMGHAIHGELSKTQPVLYESYTTATAEVASTFFENIVFDRLFAMLSPREQIIALHDKILSSLNTIFLQIAFFNFEKELHETLRNTGFVSQETMADLMIKHRGAYVGPAGKFEHDDGYFWIRLSHIRTYFYVYTYAYGELISSALYANYQKDPSFIACVKQFLSAGGSDTPENIFKSIGIDTSKDEFWIAGLKAIEDDIIKLEQLVKGSKSKKKTIKSK